MELQYEKDSKERIPYEHYMELFQKAEPAIQVISEYMRLSPGQHLSCDVLSEYPILK